MVVHLCASCDEESPDAKRCSGCHKAWYCSTQCQTSHWRFHIFDCKVGQPISTVYHLSRAIYGDVIPVDAQTRIDYGFDKAEKAVGGNAQNMLCGLYRGLFIYHEITEKEIRRWQQEGRLVEGIKTAFEALPPNNRGGYYPWFLEHQYLLDGSPLDEDDVARKTEERASTMLREGWVATGGSPNDTRQQIEAKLAALPEERRACHHFYAMIFSHSHPSPSLKAWLQFGFVAADSTGQEISFGQKYAELLQLCTFEEFCAAYETSSIPALFDRYGVHLWDSARFRDVMAGTPRVNKSVWNLKQYIDELVALQPGEDLPPLIPSVICDYGYMNCKTPAERKLLDDMYMQLFQKRGMDPVTLHEACIKGRLVEFTKGFVKLAPSTAKYTRLLKNPYPLGPEADNITYV